MGSFCTLYAIFYKNADVCIFNSKLPWLIDEMFSELLSTGRYKQSIGVIFTATSYHPHRKWGLFARSMRFFIKNADVCIFNSKLPWLIAEIFSDLLSTDIYKQSIGVIFQATSSHPHRKWGLFAWCMKFFIKKC